LFLSVSRRAAALTGALLVTVLAACSSGASTTPLPSGAEPPSDCAKVQDGVITLSAKDLKFSAPCLVANAGEKFTIHFTNQEDMPHNVAVYTDSGKGTTIVKGDVVASAGQSKDYEVPAQDEGQYYFDCDIHPEQMNGTLYVVSS
jgi:plastocyanin